MKTQTNIILILFLTLSTHLIGCEKDIISEIRIVEDNDDYVDIEVDYCISELSNKVQIRGVLENEGRRLYDKYESITLHSGRGTTVLGIPRGFINYKTFDSSHIRVDLMIGWKKKVLISTSFPFEKKWETKKLDDSFLEELIAYSVALIDSGNNKKLKLAKEILDDVLQFDAQRVSAYPELARYYMKTQGVGVRSQGILMAEQMLLTGLGIDGEHANSHVLLGYVYVWEERYKDALKEFEKAESIDTQNTWLYTNWGQMYERQNKLELAAKYYKKAAQRKRKNDTYDRAISDASRKLFYVYLQLDNYKEARAIAVETYKKYPFYVCYQARMYLVDALYLGKYENVMLEVGNKSHGCNKILREVKAVSYLRLWANSEHKDINTSDSNYIKAMGIYPDYVELIVELAKYDFAANILSKLMASRGLEVKDVNGLTPIVRAIVEDKKDSVRNLITSGVDINVVIGPDQFTPLMLSVLSRNNDMVKLLITGGADRNKKATNGMTALDIANHFKIEDIIKTINLTNGI